MDKTGHDANYIFIKLAYRIPVSHRKCDVDISALIIKQQHIYCSIQIQEEHSSVLFMYLYDLFICGGYAKAICKQKTWQAGCCNLCFTDKHKTNTCAIIDLSNADNLNVITVKLYCLISISEKKYFFSQFLSTIYTCNN